MANEIGPVLFMDDDAQRCKAFRSRCPSATIVNTSRECIAELKQRDVWDEVHLDHDLGGIVYQDSSEEESGMEVVRWMLLNKPDVRTVIVHTWNGPAGIEMVRALDAAGYYVIRAPFQRSHDMPLRDEE